MQSLYYRSTILLVAQADEHTTLLKEQLEKDCEVLHVQALPTREEWSHLENDLLIMRIDKESYMAHLSTVEHDMRLEDIPSIVVSINKSKLIETHCLKAGSRDFIALPADEDILRARVQNTLRLQARLRRLSALAIVDETTRLPNKRYFREYLDRELGRAVRAQRPISLLAADILGLPELRTGRGAAVAERCLQAAAKGVERCLQRSSDFACRYVGDKFILVLPETDEPGAAVVVGRLYEALTDALSDASPPESGFPLRALIGGKTVVPERGARASVLIRAALEQLHADDARETPSTEEIAAAG
ncbi:diguanylate cyclase domain-containing protein [Mangrovimicrobium sediminis]|nr:diguanylate cyclase [Haliea sp. SAOS-164]